MILGSGELLRSLMRHDLIDEIRLLIHPLVLGSGRRMFDDDLPLTRFKLTDSQPTTTGVIIARYQLTQALAVGRRRAAAAGGRRDSGSVEGIAVRRTRRFLRERLAAA